MSDGARPEVSVVVCAHTLDRWDDISRGMKALAEQSQPPLEVLLVVDHNDELLARASEAFPNVRVLPNVNRAGANGGRNTGVAEAKGSVIAFLDDDARPEPDWVERLASAYDDPSVQAVGGYADPVWPDRRPAHLPHELDWIVGCTYQGQPTSRADVRNLWGCNMSMRKDAFEQVGTFNEDIGRIGLIPLGADDTEWFIRLAQKRPGSRVVFEPRALVHHRVTEPRTTWAYLRSRSHAEGVSKGMMAGLVGAGDALSVEKSYVRTVLTAGFARELGRGLRGQRAGWQGAAGIVTSLWVTGWSYLRIRYSPGARRAAEAAHLDYAAH